MYLKKLIVNCIFKLFLFQNFPDIDPSAYTKSESRHSKNAAYFHAVNTNNTNWTPIDCRTRGCYKFNTFDVLLK